MLGVRFHAGSFTPVEKLEHVRDYEASMTRGQGGAYLRGFMPLRSLSGESCAMPVSWWAKKLI